MLVFKCHACRKLVHLKPMLGTLHICLNDCEQAGRHLNVIQESAGRLWWKRQRTRCATCGVKNA